MTVRGSYQKIAHSSLAWGTLASVPGTTSLEALIFIWCSLLEISESSIDETDRAHSGDTLHAQEATGLPLPPCQARRRFFFWRCPLRVFLSLLHSFKHVTSIVRRGSISSPSLIQHVHAEYCRMNYRLYYR